MVIKFMTFDVDDEFLNNRPGSPPYYGPSSSSADSSPAVSVCNGCLAGVSGLADVGVPSATGQRFSAPVQVQQSQNRGRGGNKFLLKRINRRTRYHSNGGDDDKSLQKSHDKQGTSTKQENDSNRGVEGKLVLFDDCSWAFGLEALLRASAEVLPESHWRRNKMSLEELLGEGSCLPTYKVSLKDSTTVVVKIFKNGYVTRTELREHMELLRQIRHENVAALGGYLLSRDRTLMLYDYYSEGSVSSVIQGREGSSYWEKRSSLDWETRWKIVTGVARGIAYIHKQKGGKLCHGNLTSSNVFINSQGYGCVCALDICCNTLKSGASMHAGPNMREASQASDIYSLGLLMLELLFRINPLMAMAMATTGSGSGISCSPESYYRRDGIYNFDEGLPYGKCLSMISLALSCLMDGPDEKPKIEEVVEIVENI